MSTWIFDLYRVKPILVLVATASLSACGGTGIATSSFSNSSTTVVGKDIVISAPKGYCVDEEISQTVGDNAFVLLGNCASVSTSARKTQPEVKALLTASFSKSTSNAASISAALVGMDKFVRSNDGRTALSRDSDPQSVQILDTFQKDETFFLRARDTSAGIVPGASNEYWRAYFDLKDQIVSVSVIGFKDQPLKPETGLAMLREFEHAIKSSNGVEVEPLPLAPLDQTAGYLPEPENIYEDPQQDDGAYQQNTLQIDPLRTLWAIGIFRRLAR